MPIPTLRVLVVGGGVWGLLAARALAEAGARVTVVEEHRLLGRPPHCTGLVSSRVVEGLGWPARASVSEWFESFELCGPEDCVKVAPRGGVYRLDRVKLEVLLGEAAEADGVRVVTGARVRWVRPDGEAGTPWGADRFDLVVLAEGAAGRLRGSLRIGYSGPMVYGFNALLDSGACGGLRGFRVRFTGRARGLFEWVVPTREGCLVGGGSNEPRTLGVLVPRGARRVYGGPLPLGGPSGRLRAGRVVVVGDAAGLVKPLTGGGLFPATLFYTGLRNLLARGLGGPEAAESAARAVARLLARAAPAARVLRYRPGLVGCVARAARSLGGALTGVDYDLHHSVPLEAARASPARALAAAARLAACDPWGLASLLGGLTAGFIAGSRA